MKQAAPLALEAHLAWWMREVADMRVHGTTGEAPAARFAREERQALRPLDDRPAFRQMRELTRRVQTDACVDVDTNHYSVPWTLIGAQVSVVVSNGAVRVHHAGAEVACHGSVGDVAGVLSIAPICTASWPGAGTHRISPADALATPNAALPASICFGLWPSMSRLRRWVVSGGSPLLCRRCWGG